MGLESVDFPKLREAVRIAVNVEALNVDKIRQKVQDFEVIPGGILGWGCEAIQGIELSFSCPHTRRYT